MAMSGRKPTDEATRRNRAKPVHDWFNITEIPYDGPKPELWESRRFVTKDGELEELPIDRATVQWWERISAMPHCVLWTDSDWQFALATARLVDMFHYGDRQAAAEVRLREKTLGTTFESRRDLRIRYVPAEEQEKPAAKPRARSKKATVTDIEEQRRRRLIGAS